MELTCPTGPYQFDGILEGCRSVKSMSKGFIAQRAGRCMVLALTSMGLCE
jgi:hypothetical protein